MDKDRNFSVKRNYSYISGLQTFAEDVYEISGNDSELTIVYTSNDSEKTICEKGRIVGIGFDTMKRFITFLSENSYRQGTWMGAVSDYCYGNHGAFISDTMLCI